MDTDNADRMEFICEALRELHDATPEQVKTLRDAFLGYFSRTPAAGLLVDWVPGRPPRCKEHGDLAAESPPPANAQLLMLEHMREAHTVMGTDR